jgi:hypothetical protein
MLNVRPFLCTMKRLHLHYILAASAFVLSIVSFFIVIQGASDEPYMVFRWSDAIVQVGLAMLLMLPWFQLIAGIIWGIAYWCVSAWWLHLLPWVLICEFYLFYCLSGYLQDISRYVARSH